MVLIYRTLWYWFIGRYGIHFMTLWYWILVLYCINFNITSLNINPKIFSTAKTDQKIANVKICPFDCKSAIWQRSFLYISPRNLSFSDVHITSFSMPTKSNYHFFYLKKIFKCHLKFDTKFCTFLYIFILKPKQPSVTSHFCPKMKIFR